MHWLLEKIIRLEYIKKLIARGNYMIEAIIQIVIDLCM